MCDICGSPRTWVDGPRVNRRAFLKWSSAIAATAAASSLFARAATAQGAGADLVLKGGSILTSNPRQPRVEMLALANGQVVCEDEINQIQ